MCAHDIVCICPLVYMPAYDYMYKWSNKCMANCSYILEKMSTRFDV